MLSGRYHIAITSGSRTRLSPQSGEPISPDSAAGFTLSAFAPETRSEAILLYFQTVVQGAGRQFEGAGNGSSVFRNAISASRSLPVSEIFSSSDSPDGASGALS